MLKNMSLVCTMIGLVVVLELAYQTTAAGLGCYVTHNYYGFSQPPDGSTSRLPASVGPPGKMGEKGERGIPGPPGRSEELTEERARIVALETQLNESEDKLQRWMEESNELIRTLTAEVASLQAKLQSQPAPFIELYSVGGVNATWHAMRDFCLSMRAEMCTFAQICATGKPLVTGQALSGDHWAPVLDVPNDWVQIGDDRNPRNPPRLCVRHIPLAGPPRWGIETGVYARRPVFCCGSVSL